ncbi:hypothetical protein CTheo_6165 [Ceratobasidium theobromae]|uniref:Uncharacterized protein n=1 Tax=Ceratobasidium theobromae TaxID=1582974 RepID=A0A5N5QFJ9_9AGAM|nr:hypothetical protein CTheo_6165 [Ceratobasidium theobromae]
MGTASTRKEAPSIPNKYQPPGIVLVHMGPNTVNTSMLALKGCDTKQTAVSLPIWHSRVCVIISPGTLRSANSLPVATTRENSNSSI